MPMQAKASAMIARTARTSSRQLSHLKSTRTMDRAGLSSLASTSRIRLDTPSSGTTQPRQSLSAQFQAYNAFRGLRHKSSKDSPDPIAAEDTLPSTSAPPSDDRFTSAASEELLQAPNETNRQPIGKLDRRLNITFTCTVPECGHRSSHEFSRHAYEKGIVLCQCPQCFSRHLIGRHLSTMSRYNFIEPLHLSSGSPRLVR